MKYSYNYVFISHDPPDFIITYQDLNKTVFTQHLPLPASPPAQKISNRFLRFLYRAHTSNKINRIIALPLKHLWDKKVYGISLNPLFDTAKPLCFIIDGRYMGYCGIQFLAYLRGTYHNCKIILYLSDLIKTYSWVNDGGGHINWLQHFDVVFSFDQEDAIAHGFLYYEVQPFSFYPISKDTSLPDSDVTFIGEAKNRLRTILAVYETLQRYGIKCDFYITSVPESEQRYSDKITYNKYLTFDDVLRHVVSSKCILEILQSGASSPTARISEAIIYGKKLLTNCHAYITKAYFNPEYISIFTDPHDIDIGFIKKDTGKIDFNYAPDNLSPIRMIEFIEKYLNTVPR
jgi:hypothetical protein